MLLDRVGTYGYGMCFFMAIATAVNIEFDNGRHFAEVDEDSRIACALKWRTEDLVEQTYDPNFLDWYNSGPAVYNGKVEAVRAVLQDAGRSVGPDVFDSVSWLVDCNIMLLVTSMQQFGPPTLSIRSLQASATATPYSCFFANTSALVTMSLL
jgi:hypothetical protein